MYCEITLTIQVTVLNDAISAKSFIDEERMRTQNTFASVCLFGPLHFLSNELRERYVLESGRAVRISVEKSLPGCCLVARRTRLFLENVVSFV